MHKYHYTTREKQNAKCQRSMLTQSTIANVKIWVQGTDEASQHRLFDENRHREMKVMTRNERMRSHIITKHEQRQAERQTNIHRYR